MANWYYYNKSGEKVGPISVTALKALVQQGLITRETVIVNHTGRTLIAGEVNGLTFPELPTSPAFSSTLETTPVVVSVKDDISDESPLYGLATGPNAPPIPSVNPSDAFNAALKAPSTAALDRGNQPSATSQFQFTAEEQAEIEEFLANKGSDIEAVDELGATLLHHAVSQGAVAVIKYLIFKGADVNSEGNVGTPPIAIAVVNGNIEIVKFLVSQGAGTYWRNQYGNTLIDQAKHKGHKAIVRYLSSLSVSPDTSPQHALPRGIVLSLLTKSVVLPQSKRKTKMLWWICLGAFVLTCYVAYFALLKIGNGGGFHFNEEGMVSVIPYALIVLVSFVWACWEGSKQATACPRCERIKADKVVREETLAKTKKLETRIKETRIRHSGNSEDTVIKKEYEAPVTEHTIRRYHECRFCQHDWVDIKIRKTEGWED